MHASHLIALANFVLACSITPGPNNFMLAASGVNFGFSRTLPHIAGVVLGCASMAMMVGLGLIQIFLRAPWTYTALKWISLLYIVWLAWKLARPQSFSDEGGMQNPARPMTFWAACGFQWVNPKAWMMVAAGIGGYGGEIDDLYDLTRIIAVFIVVNTLASTVWTTGGSALRPVLRSPRKRQIFNWSMAVLLIASSVAIF